MSSAIVSTSDFKWTLSSLLATRYTRAWMNDRLPWTRGIAV
jgi:hypothetical protein